MLFLVSCSSDTEQESHERPLVVGVSGDNPPFEFYQNGALVGFDIDLAKMIAARLKRPVQFKDTPFNSLVAALQSRKIDMAISAISPSVEREKAVDFTRLYHQSSSVLITPGISHLDKIEDLPGKTLGAQFGSTYAKYIKDVLAPKYTFTSRILGKMTDLIQELRTQRIDGIITGTGEAALILSKNPSFVAIALPESTSGSAVALPKNAPLTETVDTILAELITEGEITSLQEKWGVKD